MNSIEQVQEESERFVRQENALSPTFRDQKEDLKSIEMDKSDTQPIPQEITS